MTIKIIKKLREETGAGISDVKKALDEANGNEQKAVEILRKAGQKIAVKKAERSTNEGLIAMEKQGNKIAIVGLACETDFVARNKDFISAVSEYAKKLMEVGESEFSSWAGKEIQDNLIAKIGENIQLSHYKIIEGEVLGSYLHSNKKIASVVSLEGGNEGLAKEIAMHVAAMNPTYLKPEDVPTDVLEKEKEIYREQLKSENKPDDIIEKILQGKVEKFYTEVCLLKQIYVKDDKMTVEEFLQDSGSDVKIKEFVRFSL